jgi:hypothetical protein
MNPEIARNQNYDYHYANDSKDVHSALLPLHDDGARYARTPCIAPSFRHRRLGSTEAKQVQAIVIATAYTPNSRLLRRSERARGQ